MDSSTEAIVRDILALSPYLDVVRIDQAAIPFEERVRLQCYHCPKYGKCWTCPPSIPDIDYERVFSEYANRLLVMCSMPVDDATMEYVRRESTNILHKALLAAEKQLWRNDEPMAVSFIGGSCKLCAEGCDPEGCRQPKLARIPLEATRANVIRAASSVGVKVTFPPQGQLVRIGLLMW